MATPIRDPSPPRISEADFRGGLALTALEMSRRRKAQVAIHMGPNRFWDSLPSTECDSLADWRHARIIRLMQVMTGVQRPDELESACYKHFTEVWLDEIKEFLAFNNWVDESHDWSDEDGCRWYYFKACAMLRDILVDPEAKIVADGYPTPLQYLDAAYLDHSRRPDLRRLSALIASKAARLQTGNTTVRAENFVTEFYGNIRTATYGDSAAIERVLGAVQHGGSSPQEPDVVNGFETLLVILFLDPHKIQAYWNKRVKEETL